MYVTHDMVSCSLSGPAGAESDSVLRLQAPTRPQVALSSLVFAVHLGYHLDDPLVIAVNANMDPLVRRALFGTPHLDCPRDGSCYGLFVDYHPRFIV